MESILVRTESKTYKAFVGVGVTKEITSFLTNHFHGLTRILIITDETVASLYLDALLSALSGWKPVIFTAPSGEKAKTFEVYYQALTVALENALDRKSLILSFGGGAVGDLAGFVAATFMRGIPFIQIPTTILAHDSAVGGKVAINHPLGKNLIGAFHQPEAVFYDLDFLETLPTHEIRSGFAEVIKHALIYDPEFLNWLQTNIHDLNSLSLDMLAQCLSKGIKIKGEFVSKDERETGIRAYLNFGHTLGHAIESEMGYGNFTHGEAVMIGMVFALKLSKDLLGLSFDIEQFKHWVQSLGYRTDIPTGLTEPQLLKKMHQDKKTIGTLVRFVLLKKLGEATIQEISDDYITQGLISF